MTIHIPRPLRTGLFYALRTAFRLVPMPVATRDRLRQRFLDRHADLVPPPPRGQTATGTGIHRPLVRSDERAIGYVPYRQGALPDPLPATLVAFYLPQFHTIPENDEWWGKGFTEWRNVARALPQFEGHHQPRLPGDLGFYDLRNPEVMREQARLAREYGISAFCFYFYWFGGKTLLETPLRNWLDDKTIDLQFCLCWANEKWSRTWDGRGDEILIDQQHSPEDDIAFIAHVAEYMRDPRYLRVDGKPMLLIYRPGLFPDMKATAERWRHWCAENGIGDIHLAYVQSFDRSLPHASGLDAAVEFPPNLSVVSPINTTTHLLNPDFEGHVLDWREMAQVFRQTDQIPSWLYRGVNCGWDNEPRRPGRGRNYLHAAPRRYLDWLRYLIQGSADYGHVPMIFINAWNEWAEGAVLEPDASLGYAYLDATRTALKPPHASRRPCSPCVVIHAWYPEILAEMIETLSETGLGWKLVVTTSPAQEESVRHVLSRSGYPSELHVFENRGRDILPFLRVFGQLLDAGEDVVLKLHTKRSPHRRDGDAWRRDLLDKLVSFGRAKAILSAFESDHLLGMVGPEGHLLHLTNHWGANAALVQQLVSRLGIREPQPEHDAFVSGSMFWVRLSALRPLMDAHLYPSDFEEELGQTDGTLAHAIERVLMLCVCDAGLTVASAGDIAMDHSVP